MSALTATIFNNGLTNTAAGAFLTVQGAYNNIYLNYDASRADVTISVQDGTYSTRTIIGNSLVGQNRTQLIISGGPGAILDCNSENPTIQIYGSGTKAQIDGGITIQNSGNGHAIRVADCAYGELGNVTYGPTGGCHIVSAEAAHIFISTDYSISGGASSHYQVQGNANLEMFDLSVTITGSPAFDQFAEAFGGGCIQSSGNTYGVCTGRRFNVYTDGVIDKANSLSYFPGNADGIVTGGRYTDYLYTGFSPPNTQTGATYTMLPTDASIIANQAGTLTLTLQDASNYPGFILYIKTITASAVVSDASNVVAITGGAAGTAILPATSGAWAMLQSDGVDWITMMRGT